MLSALLGYSFYPLHSRTMVTSAMATPLNLSIASPCYMVSTSQFFPQRYFGPAYGWIFSVLIYFLFVNFVLYSNPSLFQLIDIELLLLSRNLTLKPIASALSSSYGDSSLLGMHLLILTKSIFVFKLCSIFFSSVLAQKIESRLCIWLVYIPISSYYNELLSPFSCVIAFFSFFWGGGGGLLWGMKVLVMKNGSD